MSQQLGLDRLAAVSYLVLLTSCAPSAPGASVPAPDPVVPWPAAARWAAATAPEGYRLLRFRWLFNDGQASVGGQGTARLAAPDSMRFDIAGPLGIGAAAAVVVGEEPQWVAPPDIIARLIPSYPLMWAIFGVMRPPPIGAVLRGAASDTGTALQWADGADTVRYVVPPAGPGIFRSEWRRGGVTMGIVETKLDAAGAPVSSRLTVPSVPARLDVTIVADSIAGPFAADVWTPPRR